MCRYSDTGRPFRPLGLLHGQPDRRAARAWDYVDFAGAGADAGVADGRLLAGAEPRVVYALHKPEFVAAVATHSAAAREGERLVGRLTPEPAG